MKYYDATAWTGRKADIELRFGIWFRPFQFHLFYVRKPYVAGDGELIPVYGFRIGRDIMLDISCLYLSWGYKSWRYFETTPEFLKES